MISKDLYLYHVDTKETRTRAAEATDRRRTRRMWGREQKLAVGLYQLPRAG